MKSDFGFSLRDPSQKTEEVQHLFKRVATRYDLMNDAMSFGLHRHWKRAFVEELPLSYLPSGAEFPLVLDMATGTGDIAERLFQRAQRLGVKLELLLGDLNLAMLQTGQKREGGEGFHWLCGNAEALPLSDAQVSLYTIAFGLRNVTDKEKALAEAFRVLRAGGFFYCLEFSHPVSPWMQGLYDFYSFGWIPLLGALLAKDRDAYTYLVESIRMFPNASFLEVLIQEAGFRRTGFRLLSQGLVAIHWGQKEG